MKKNFFLTLILFLAFCLAGHGQTQKGSKLIGGGASVQFNDPFSIGLYPRFGYFIINNLALGAQLPLFYSNNSQIENISVGLSPFIRYYFGDAAKTRVFVGALGGVSKGWQTYEDYGSSKYASNNFGLDAGVVHFITNQIGFEAALNYANDKNANSFSRTSRIERVTLNFGFQIYLPSSSE